MYWQNSDLTLKAVLYGSHLNSQLWILHIRNPINNCQFWRSVNPCRRTSVSWKRSFCNQCAESDWFSILIQYLVFKLNTPAVTWQIATRKTLVRFRMYVVQKEWPNSGTWGQGNISVKYQCLEIQHSSVQDAEQLSLCWYSIKWGLDGLQRALTASSIVCVFLFFKKTSFTFSEQKSKYTNLNWILKSVTKNCLIFTMFWCH